MNIFQIIADIINKILTFSLPSLPSLPSIPSIPNPLDNTPYTNVPGMYGGGGSGWTEKKGDRCSVSVPEIINPTARFHSTGSPAWANQFKGTAMEGQHGGTDYTGAMGQAVYTPLPGKVIKVGHYSDAGRYGDYVMIATDNGLEYYSGHLQNVKVKEGDSLACGQPIGEMNAYNHTHIQIRKDGNLIDPESVLT